jgi:hypothetical protein
MNPSPEIEKYGGQCPPQPFPRMYVDRIKQFKFFLLRLYMVCGHCPSYIYRYIYRSMIYA